MSDMRLIVAGAGGRMGRTLVKAIAETPGLALVGATEGEGSPFLSQDSGVLAGLPPNRVIVTSEVRPLTLAADGILDFTVPYATVKLAELAAETGAIGLLLFLALVGGILRRLWDLRRRLLSTDRELADLATAF